MNAFKQAYFCVQKNGGGKLTLSSLYDSHNIIGSLSLSAQLLGVGMSLSTIVNMWPLILAIGLIGLVAAIAWFISSKKQQSLPLVVQRKSRFLNPSQRQFFDALVDALGDQYFIFSRVGMRGVVEHKQEAGYFQRSRTNKQIENSYFDFVLCQKLNMSIFAAIELQNFDGKSKRNRLKREALLARVCKGAGLKLFYFDVRQNYKSTDLARLITGRSKAKVLKTSAITATHESQLSMDTLSQSVLGHQRTCPKCRSEVVTKVAVRGSQLGKKFLMCRKYPYCDYQVLSTEENISRIEQEERRKSNFSGFNNWS